MRKAATIYAPAKLNLFLMVLPQVVEGYHHIETVYQAIDLYDKLAFDLELPPTPGCEIAIETTENSRQRDDIPCNASNLVHTAASLFFKTANISDYSLRVRLHKQIPVAGGLAGGSSDAAATLYILNHLLGERLSSEDLLELARQLGSDVPFCLLGGCMMGTGRGDRLFRLPINREHVYLLLIPPPDCRLKAGDVYQAYDANPCLRPPPKAEVNIANFVQHLMAPESDICTHLFNSLEDSACQLAYWVEQAKADTEALGAKFIVSGSGPTLFAALQDELAAHELAGQLVLKGYDVALHRSIEDSFQIVVH